MELGELVEDFATAIESVDARRPQAVNQRSKVPYQPGIGPHTEAGTVALVMGELATTNPHMYASHALGVPYPGASRQKCDLCLGTSPSWQWAIEVKMIRMLGDNGKANDNLPTHMLSPYPSHRSALTDCVKLVESGLGDREAILMYGYDSDEFPVMDLIDAFTTLARERVHLGPMAHANFGGLIHPVHQRGVVVAWELFARGSV